MSATLEPGSTLPEQRYRVTRADLVRYAGASGDFNPIHWSDRVAGSVGLPGVIAHGMFTMALAARALDTWAGAPGRVRELGCKFTKPVVVPDDDKGALVEVSGVVTGKLDGNQVTVDVTARSGDTKAAVTAARMAMSRHSHPRQRFRIGASRTAISGTRTTTARHGTRERRNVQRSNQSCWPMLGRNDVPTSTARWFMYAP